MSPGLAACSARPSASALSTVTVASAGRVKTRISATSAAGPMTSEWIARGGSGAVEATARAGRQSAVAARPADPARKVRRSNIGGRSFVGVGGP